MLCSACKLKKIQGAGSEEGVGVNIHYMKEAYLYSTSVLNDTFLFVLD